VTTSSARVRSSRRTLYVVSVFVAWYLIIFGILHVVGALAGPKVDWWWTQLLLGVAEGVLGVWAVRSWQRSLLTLVTLVGVWAIFLGGERDLRRVLPTRGRQAGGAAGRLIAAGRAAGQAHRGGMLGGAHPGSALPLVGV